MSSSSTNGVMFQLKVDPLTGNSEWIVIQEQDEDDFLLTSNNPKQLLANTCYLDMLNDTPRNTAYRNAIDSTLSKHSLTHVLDIGSGTGLLSMMAARAMGISSSTSTSQGTVTACESYLPMLKLMKKVLRANNMDGKIRLF
ncbi:protein arginine N-methyltransferase 7, partial [Tanacetum coccineum]